MMIRRMFIVGFISFSYSLFGTVYNLEELSYQLSSLSSLKISTVEIKDVIIDKEVVSKLMQEVSSAVALPRLSNEWSYLKGYYYIDNLMTGSREEININKLIRAINKNESEEKISNIKQQLVNQYKIHLMPRSIDDLKKILILLFNKLKEDPALGKALNTLKFKRNTHFGSKNKLKESLKKIEGTNVLYVPIVVIYPGGTKESAEYILNAILNLYKNIKGADITPRYNLKINDLIYYAQGDGDDKVDSLARYYDKDRIFYRKDFQGMDKDYSLKIDPNFKL